MGSQVKWAQRWIMLGPLELQPSELMKISLVLALSRFLHGKSVEDISKPLPLLIALTMIAIPALFVVLEPNLGTTMIIIADGCSMLFLAGLSWYWRRLTRRLSGRNSSPCRPMDRAPSKQGK